MKTVKLGDVAQVSSSKRIFARQYTDKGVPFYRQKEIIEISNGRNISEPLFISKDLYENIKKKFGVPQKGDLLITAVGVTLGIPYIIGDEKFYFKDGNLIWCKDFYKCVNPKYLYYWIKTEAGQRSIWARTIGSAQPALTIDLIKQYEIPLPDIEKQNKIVMMLDSYRDLITNNQRQIELLEEAAQRLYKEWFVDLRFPGHENVKIVDGVPEGWKIGRADDFFDISIGKTPPRAEKQWFVNETEGVAWASISDMGDAGVFIFHTSEGITEEAAEKHNMKVVPAGTILLSFKLTLGRVSITTKPMCTNEAIAHFRIEKPEDREYTYSYLKNFEYDTLGNTSSISKAVNSKIVKAMTFVSPDKEIKIAYSKRVAPILNEIFIKQKQVISLTEARDRLLPKLMSGEIEV